MNPVLLASLITIFLAVALLVGFATSMLLSRSAPGRRRLRGFEPGAGVVTGVVEGTGLTETADPQLAFLSRTLPSSPKDVGRLRRQLAAAGYYDLSAAVYFNVARIVLPFVFAGLLLSLLGTANSGWVVALMAGVV